MTMPPLRLVIVIGTRPEAIKLMPIIHAARERPEAFSICIIRTGQHRDLVDGVMDEFGVRADFNLDLMRTDQDLAHVVSESVRGLSDHIARERPAWVIVQGDTATTFAGALAAFYNRVPVAHVEAGLRTGDLHSPFPEEANRSLTTRISDLHFAPTDAARDNLLREGIAAAAIVVTGNTGIDALRLTLDRPRDAADQSVGRYILVTAHRRESHGLPMGRICEAIRVLLDRHPDLTVLLPMHPSPPVRATIVASLGDHPRVRLVEPLGYFAFSRALADSALVLTDSGGIQEECTALGKPVLVMREDTERPEAVDAGVSIVVGTDVDRIVSTASRLLDDPEAYRLMARPSTAYGTGRAASRILDTLLARSASRATR